jgi:hypothetical protein
MLALRTNWFEQMGLRRPLTERGMWWWRRSVSPRRVEHQRQEFAPPSGKWHGTLQYDYGRKSHEFAFATAHI